MRSNIGPWNDFEIVEPRGVKKRAKFHPDVNGRPIFFGPDGNPMLTVREPSKKIAGHLTDHMTSGIAEIDFKNIEESKEESKDATFQ